ncbi:MAG: mannose-phosphate guanylyltransferase [Epulopiscium sp.]|nr:mannose-phosphate guanylyltransferase [Candidatus Epulonipiscium sp.]
MKRYSVIMAGGGGTRFWPLSRQASPKQILNLSGNDVMINETINRINPLVPYHQTLIVTNQVQEEIMQEVLIKAIPKKNILLEPLGRNTAPCIGYAAMVLRKRDQDALMCVLPSDHFIKNESEFVKVLEKCFGLAESTNNLITIGIKPTFPCTGYGYIHMGKEIDSNVYEVEEFVEKPNIQKAREYLESGKFLWNSGMFVWKVSTILDNIKRFLPKLYDKLLELEPYIDTEEEAKALDDIYPQMQSISIDYGIMERSNEVLVIPGDFGWNDVGSWDSLGSIYEADERGNIIIGDHVHIDTTHTIAYGKEHLIAALGVDNLIIVHTPDATLVCPKDRAQDVKRIVDELKSKNRSELL